MASITHFGQSMSNKGLKSCDLVNQALGGWLSVTGEPQMPLKLFGRQSYNTASLLAVNGILMALWQRHATRRGQYIDISIIECVTATLDYVLVRYFYDGIVSQRQGSRHWNNDFRVFACQDGYILLSLHHQWETLVEWLESEGMAGDLTDGKWRDRQERDRNIDHIIAIFERWTLNHKVEELEEKGQLMHFPWAEVKAAKNG
jgi:crotonobetainyl-CoA:carnitine CoA-transferase CaiB-like acyl-CoA transferase